MSDTDTTHVLPNFPAMPRPVARGVMGDLFDRLKMQGYAASYASTACAPLLKRIDILGERIDSQARTIKAYQAETAALRYQIDLLKSERQTDTARPA